MKPKFKLALIYTATALLVVSATFVALRFANPERDYVITAAGTLILFLPIEFAVFVLLVAGLEWLLQDWLNET